MYHRQWTETDFIKPLNQWERNSYTSIETVSHFSRKQNSSKLEIISSKQKCSQKVEFESYSLCVIGVCTIRCLSIHLETTVHSNFLQIERDAKMATPIYEI